MMSPDRIVDAGEMLNSAGMDRTCPQYRSLRQHYLFSGLPQEDFDALASHVAVRRLNKGKVLFQPDEDAHSFYYVDSGQVELILMAASGERKTLEIIGPTRTFAEAVAFMRRKKYPVAAEALEDCVLCEIPNSAYLGVLADNNEASLRLLADVCMHLRARVREIELLTIQNGRSRLCSYLLDHIVDSTEDEATIRLDLPRHVIASRLSMQPETLSRLLRTLVDEGILTIEDRVMFVHSLTRLRPYD